MSWTPNAEYNDLVMIVECFPWWNKGKMSVMIQLQLHFELQCHSLCRLISSTAPRLSVVRFAAKYIKMQLQLIN